MDGILMNQLEPGGKKKTFHVSCHRFFSLIIFREPYDHINMRFRGDIEVSMAGTGAITGRALKK